jgi:hypothetical protein
MSLHDMPRRDTIEPNKSLRKGTGSSRNSDRESGSIRQTEVLPRSRTASHANFRAHGRRAALHHPIPSTSFQSDLTSRYKQGEECSQAGCSPNIHCAHKGTPGDVRMTVRLLAAIASE